MPVLVFLVSNIPRLVLNLTEFVLYSHETGQDMIILVIDYDYDKFKVMAKLKISHTIDAQVTVNLKAKYMVEGEIVIMI